jgi:hypothetical protein
MIVEIEREACEPTSRRRAEAERGLLRAMLTDAVRCLLGEVGGPPEKRERLAIEAREWFAAENDFAPYSFENVCAWLGLPASRFRTFLLEQAASPAVIGRPGASRHPGALESRLKRERNARIQALRAAGTKPREIAERFGLSYSSILLICADDREESAAEEIADIEEPRAAAGG